eukprot:CAMPEP_0178927718 /NCGR_PEP_ID=MMETSP0786-20121207/19384_1 /TAXON_ID=186022 /ORGANISM="Thalassionema frauenfeldii, Strain CCMP 1798" /LENGTH=262 /DNA_ID=CAMNT_0020603263 /DNA_START=623 /DNA_END=1411 /DNA_ORIENTATION=-
MLAHSRSRWPDAVNIHLWPYALRNATQVLNSTTNHKNGMSPIKLFASTPVKPKLDHFHPFGCPVYVLKNKLAAGQGIPKWELRARVRIYLGPSPLHARSVANVLNLKTGLVSPQYHVRYDDMFETVKDPAIPKSKWQIQAHFVESDFQESAKNGNQSRKASSNLEERVQMANDPMEAIQDLPLAELHPEEQQLEFDTGNDTLNEDTVQAPPPAEPPPQSFLRTTRRGRTPRPSAALTQALDQVQQKVVAFLTEFAIQAYAVE